MAPIAAMITCRDLGRTLLDALASIERQTRPASEIIVVDDGSAEIYTRQLLQGLQQRGTFVAQAGGGGASAARNLGARLTSADYLVWLDADDILDSTYFSAAAARLDADPELDFVSCAIRAFGEASYTWRPAFGTFVEMISTGAWPHASTMIRRRLWETVGGFDETLPLFELLDFWASAIAGGARGIVLDEPLLNYRVRPGSRYRRMIQPSTYVTRLAQFYAKHGAAIDRHGLEIIEGKEAFFLSQRRYHQELEGRARSLEAELAQLQSQATEAARRLESCGAQRIAWGDLARLQPISGQWGRDRGTAIDRYYIEHFLDRHRADIQGRVLEVFDSQYTRRFGGTAVTASDVIDVNPANSAATVVADLRHADAIAAQTYDCIILTQTLQLIDDMAAALAECVRILRPGGILLVTVPGISKVDDEAGPDGDFWRLTEASARRLFADVFPIESFDVRTYGNVRSSAAFLYGISVEEMLPADLDHRDAAFPLVMAVRAVKPPTASSSAVHVGAARQTAVIVAYHRVAELDPDSHALCTPPEVFREHMACVRRDFLPIRLEDLIRAAASGRIPEGAIAVTLDDGYFDALTVASPILLELGIPATFFVNSDRLHEEHERWWDVLEHVFRSASALPSELGLVVNGQALRMRTTTPQQRVETLARLNQAAWPLNANGRQNLVNDVLTWSGGAGAPRSTHRVLTATEIEDLAGRPGHTIGAHTVHHLALTTQSAETKRREVLENKATLERVLGQTLQLFAYPYGDFDAELVTIVGEAFLGAVTVQAGTVSAGTNRLLLPRYEITPRDHHDLPFRTRAIVS